MSFVLLLCEIKTLEREQKFLRKLLTCLKMFGILYERVREKRAPREDFARVFDTLFAD